MFLCVLVYKFPLSIAFDGLDLCIPHIVLYNFECEMSKWDNKPNEEPELTIETIKQNCAVCVEKLEFAQNAQWFCNVHINSQC